MKNPFNTLNPSTNNPSMNSIQNAYRMLMSSPNPMALLQNMAQQNPSLQPVVQILKQGGNPQQVFINLCQQRGIDPNQFIKQIQDSLR